MGSYRVSYKLLRQQGDELIAVGKTLDEYSERVSKIRSQLGSDEMLEPIRANLQKLQQQLGESRTVLNTAGTLLSKSVDSYADVELKQVKKVDSMKAHNRDFYKNPVVVASAGGGGTAGAATAAKAAAATSTTTNNITNTDNSVHITYAESAPDAQPVAAVAPAAGSPAVAADPLVHSQTGASTPATSPNPAAPVHTPAAVPKPAAPTHTPAAPKPAAPASSGGLGAGATAAIIGGGAAVAAGAAAGGITLKKKHGKKNPSDDGSVSADDNTGDLEAELERAKQRVRELEDEE